MMSTVIDRGMIDQGRSNEAAHLPYYHPSLSNMEDVLCVMKDYVSKDGHFLIRNSFSKPGMFTVTVVQGGGIKHFNISRRGEQFFLQDRAFHSIENLVKHYKNVDVPNIEKIPKVRLKTPILYIKNSSPGLKLRRALNDPLPVLMRPQGKQSSNKNPVSVASVDSGFAECICCNSVRNTPTDFSAASVCSHMEDATDKRNKVGVAMPQPSGNASPRVLNHGYSDATRRSSVPRPRLPPLPTELQDTDSGGYYSTVRDYKEEMVPTLIETLRLAEEGNEDRCECGLLYSEAELPLGWSMHLSTESETIGKIFFTGPEGETAWQLPFDICLQLTPEQQDRIRDLKARLPNTSNSHKESIASVVVRTNSRSDDHS